MSIFSRLFRRREPTKADNPPPEFLRAYADRLRYQPPDYSLADNQLKSYQAISWVAISINAVGDGCAAQKFNVMRMTGEDTEQIDNHEFEQLLRRPNDLQSRSEFIKSLAAYYRLAGNAYVWLNRPTGGPPVEMFSLSPNRIRPITGGTIGLIDHYEWDAGTGATYKIPPDDVVHIKNFHSRDMFVGMSMIEPLAIQLEKDHKAQKYDLAFYADDYAKPEGILGFKGQVDKNILEAFKAEWRRRHGGTKREMGLIWGIDDLDFIPLALNYLDMEFLPNRTFTKEEVFAALAPGLASVLAVNATEANSQAGKATLAEFAISPVLVALQESITNRILPLYGDNLVGEFEDPRLPDRAMELQEINEYSKTHTVDEVRARYYQDPPIGDERGDLLPSQVTGSTGAGNASDGETSGGIKSEQIFGYHIESGAVTRNEVRESLGLPPVDDAAEKERRDLLAKIDVIKAAADTGIEEVINAALEQVGFEGTYKKPVPPQLQPGDNNNDEQVDGTQVDDTEDEPPVKARIVQSSPAQLVHDELRSWRRFELRRVGKENTREFETKHIPDWLADQVRAELDGAKAHDDIEDIFAKAQDQADDPEPPKLNWRFEPGDRIEDIEVPPITEADMEAARRDLALIIGEVEAERLVSAELGRDDRD